MNTKYLQLRANASVNGKPTGYCNVNHHLIFNKVCVPENMREENEELITSILIDKLNGNLNWLTMFFDTLTLTERINRAVVEMFYRTNSTTEEEFAELLLGEEFLFEQFVLKQATTRHKIEFITERDVLQFVKNIA